MKKPHKQWYAPAACLARRSTYLAPVLAGAFASLGYAQNLLQNGSFETGMAPWSPIGSTAMDVSYGSANAPGVAVGAHVGAGNRLLKDIGGGAVVEQIVVTGPIPAGQNLDVEGYFGGIGAATDSSRLVIRFLDASGAEIAIRPLPTVTREDRNNENVVMLRRMRIEPPLGTEQIAARIEFQDPCCGGTFGCADAIYVGLTSQPLIPAPLPLDTQLVTNGGLESGYAPGSPLTLVDAGGWYGTGGTSIVKAYSNADTTVPDTIVGAIIGGQARLLSDATGAGGLAQVLDVRGNANQIFAGLDLVVSAHLGGVGNSADTARIEVEFQDGAGNPVGFGINAVGPVTSSGRNQQTVVVRREELYTIPQGTAYIRLAVAFDDPCCGGSFGLVDNITARLVAPAPIAPLPFGVNIVSNGSLEMGSLPGSPLELNNPLGWRGVGTGTVDVLFYGGGPELPGVTFAATNGLGGAAANDGTGLGALRQTRDLRGLAALIDQGQIRLDARCWLGGFGSSADTATCTLRFLSEFGVPMGLPIVLGPVTAADRVNMTTLLARQDSSVAPFGARSLSIQVNFADPCCGGSNGSFDAVEVVLNDNSSIGTSYCNAAPNSTGLPGQLRATGSALASDNNVTLVASGLPGLQFGFFLNSQTAGFVPNPGGSDGNLCLGGEIGRYINPVLQASPMGVMSKTLDLGATPTPMGLVSVVAGQSWHFQAWHRDSGATPTSNFSQGLRIDFN